MKKACLPWHCSPVPEKVQAVETAARHEEFIPLCYQNSNLITLLPGNFLACRIHVPPFRLSVLVHQLVKKKR
ncbi:hypothetical protein E2C01_067741 [Portunus trituberculatus]|uniref:Uncharacterized protein n=1 Tax=Portunus trituberculatus TaxID=210409 RepID=A0A5B7HTP7_PORTR|nr:hypothetical protein [Portunus trituberculatus]